MKNEGGMLEGIILYIIHIMTYIYLVNSQLNWICIIFFSIPTSYDLPFIKITTPISCVVQLTNSFFTIHLYHIYTINYRLAEWWISIFIL